MAATSRNFSGIEFIGALPNPNGVLQINGTPAAPTVSSVALSGAGISAGESDLDAGKTVTLTLNLSEVVKVAGGAPTLTLNDGATATYSGGSGTSALTFSYTVAAGQNTPTSRRPVVNLNSATITEGAGNAPTFRSAADPDRVCKSTPRLRTAPSLAESPLSGDLDAGKNVTLTLNLSEGGHYGRRQLQRSRLTTAPPQRIPAPLAPRSDFQLYGGGWANTSTSRRPRSISTRQLSLTAPGMLPT